MAQKPWTARALVCAFFAAFLVLGFWTAADYGPCWDEPDEMDILRMNLWEYARVLGLDESPFLQLAQDESRPVINALVPISQSIEKDHGAACMYPLAAVVMSQQLSEAQRSALWHMGCWTWFTLGAFALYAACRELGLPRPAGVLAALTLLLSPRFFAQGHYNNKDIVLFSLCLCLLWQALALLRRPSAWRGAVFSLFGALAANTKLMGVGLWLLCGAAVTLGLASQRRLNRRTLGVAGFTVAAFAAFYAALTPALWADPAGYWRYALDNSLFFSRWENRLLFRGTVFDFRRDAMPWYYLPYMILATTPLWALALIGLGTVAALGAAARSLRALPMDEPGEKAARFGAEGIPLLLTILMWALPLGLALVTRTRVYNGWRHFYFLYGPMLALAAYAAHAVFKRARPFLRRLFAAALAGCLLVSAAGILREHPYQYAYYQPLAQKENFQELDYWNVSARNALEQLAQNTEGVLAVAGADIWAQDALAKALYVMPDGLRSRFDAVALSQASYVLVNPSYAIIGGLNTEGMREVVSLRSYGQTITQIFEVEVDAP